MRYEPLLVEIVIHVVAKTQQCEHESGSGLSKSEYEVGGSPVEPRMGCARRLPLVGIVFQLEGAPCYRGKVLESKMSREGAEPFDAHGLDRNPRQAMRESTLTW